ncbi:VOC family protein [Hyalangium sp.]|uniref:VOC family protein n=1 Tax=Hyalangium sp. TaxID=2028555 RepID=UPI002D22EA37|nr:VOC family protein [Hyalangium sp.]HYI00152.1 VOC family protein [Hyalangium sp.]
MAKRDKADPSTVSWVDLQTPDLDKARKFYGELLGWSFVGGDDPNAGFYTMAQLGGRNVAGMAKLRAGSPFPPMWSIYLAVENADEIARKITEAGGKIVVPPMDVMEEGRMGYFADPTGAHFGVWQGRRHQGAQVIEETGSMTWHEVYTRDLAKARPFYMSVFGLEVKRLDAPGIDYWTLQKGGRTVFGAMQMSAQFPPEVPSHWNTYFAVTDTDAAAKKAGELGGTVMAPPFDTPYGRMAVIADPAGAAFCVIKPVSSSSVW